jgi:hypothetical protein
MERVPGIDVLDAPGLILRVRVADDRFVRVQVDEEALVATVRRVAADEAFRGLAGSDAATRAVTLFLLELQGALSQRSDRPVRFLRYTGSGMVAGPERAGIPPAER